MQWTGNHVLYVGESPAGTSARVQQLVDALVRVGMQAEATAQIQTIEWSKFVAWLGFMAVAVLTRLETYKFFLDPDTALVCTRLMREIARLAAQRGIALVDMPAFPVHTIISGTEAEGVETLRERGAQMQARASRGRVSSLQDLERGRRLEVEETLGYVVAHAATAGLAVPTVDTCYHLISGINRYVQRVSG